MATHRVVVVWKHGLFHDSLRLLLDRPGIEVVATDSDHAVARERIARLQPDTVLVEEDEEEDITEKMVRLLEASPLNVRIFRLSLNNNELKLYRREKRTIGKTEDLINLIQNEPGGPYQ